MKLVAIAGSFDKGSYNRMLVDFMAKEYTDLADIEVLDVDQVPLFDRDLDYKDFPQLVELNAKISAADGVILATPEHNHTTTVVMKSILEWLSSDVHPFQDKAVMIVGASHLIQGTSRAQADLREILDAPGVNAIPMTGNEFLMGNCQDKFDENGNISDEGTVKFLKGVLAKFTEWVNMVNGTGVVEAAADDWKNEDLTASGKTDTTIDVDMMSKDWVNQASAKVNAASDRDYVKLDSGVLSVNQLNWFLKTMPMELTFMDDNAQFIYYNHMLDRDDMLAPRYPWQTGMPMSEVHPERAKDGVKYVIHQLRTGKKDLVEMPVPGNKLNEKWIMHYYKRMADDNGQFRGINEWVLDLWPIVKSYLDMTGQKLVQDPTKAVDAEGGASGSAAPAAPAVDASAGASDEEATPAPAAPAVDASAGASDEEETTTAAPVKPVQVETTSVDTAAGASDEERDDAEKGIPDVADEAVDTDAGASM